MQVSFVSDQWMSQIKHIGAGVLFRISRSMWTQGKGINQANKLRPTKNQANTQS